MAYNSVAQASSDVFSDASSSAAFESPKSDVRLRPMSTNIENSIANSRTRARQGTEDGHSFGEDKAYDDVDPRHLMNRAPGPENNTDDSVHPPHFASMPIPIQPGTAHGLLLKSSTTQSWSSDRGYIVDEETQVMGAAMNKEGPPEEQHSSAPPTSGSLLGLIPDPSPIYQPSRQISTTSLSNSFIAVNVVSSSVVPSARPAESSVLSRSWSYGSDQLDPSLKDPRLTRPSSDHDLESQKPSSKPIRPSSVSACPPPQPPLHIQLPGKPIEGYSSEHPQQPQEQNDLTMEISKPLTSASNDAHREAVSPFVDFDGVHYNVCAQQISDRQHLEDQQGGIDRLPLADEDISSGESPPGENKLFYPAPVPMILNLPPKLSKLPSAEERERRRLKALHVTPSDMRKSAAWLNEEAKIASLGEHGGPKAQGSLPPQLRASAFFDQPSIRQQVNVKGASATETLDRILEASAYAPVTAFTDHPYARHREYRKSPILDGNRNPRYSHTGLPGTGKGLDLGLQTHRRQSSAEAPIGSPGHLSERRSKSDQSGDGVEMVDGEHEPLRNSADLGDHARELENLGLDGAQEEGLQGEAIRHSERGDEEGSEGELEVQGGPPTTLLAELQLRKAQQKQRRRTAANAFPNGMHSTLLELDAVMQIQQKSRKKKHVTLAWENREAGDPTTIDDDDVPLGLLVAGGQGMQQNMSQPMGLVAKRAMEENEPLSRRRARLKGESMVWPGSHHPEQQGTSTMYTLDIPALIDRGTDEREGETLAQRMQRIKSGNGRVTGPGAEFVEEVSSQLGLKTEHEVPVPPSPEAEETMGQRRKRLRDEALKGSLHPSAGSTPIGQEIRAQSSMADVLSRYGQPQDRPDSMQFRPSSTGAHPMPLAMAGYAQLNASMPYLNSAADSKYLNPTYRNPTLAMQAGRYGQNGYPYNPAIIEPSLDPNQRDMIDRWRQGVAP